MSYARLWLPRKTYRTSDAADVTKRDNGGLHWRYIGMPENDNGEQKPAEPKTLTQEQVNALLADQKRKLTEKFGDYDDLKAKADQLDQLSESAKSDIEKALERAAKAEAEVAKYQQREQIGKWADEITKGSDVPATLLRGTTREELEQHFNQLKEQFAARVPKPKRTPVPAGQPSGEGQGSRAAAALRELRGVQ